MFKSSKNKETNISCLNCSYCARYRVYYSQFNPKPRTIFESLTTEERHRISENDFVFLGEEERKYKEYKAEYDKREIEELHKDANPPHYAVIRQPKLGIESDFDSKKAQKWGMEKPPEG